MRGVPAPVGTGNEERLAEKGEGPQPDEGPRQVFRLKDPSVRDFHGRYGDLAQV